ncbi:PAS domain S-box protein [Magnetovirga frankeli]|uniref:ATP-binding protein n=1 Tax=Magnetovirga frankeli TaxID=947516 RepID=UPI0012932BD9|nr:PAS domain S-box protein [gamma proteobacterium SS-5]
MSRYSETQLQQALARCADEPIHQLGRIQPQGYLLVLSADAERCLLQVSANGAELFALADVQAALNQPLAQLLGEAAVTQVEQLIAHAGERFSGAGWLNLAGGEAVLQARLFLSDGLPVLELSREDPSQGAAELAEIVLRSQRALLRLDQEPEEIPYMRQLAGVAQRLTGFDRVMIYRFDGNWDGEVIAEALSPGMTAYLGTRFPASDIPPQARALYALNPLRQVHDVEAEDVALLPRINPHSGAPLDLSLSALRSFSPVHVEYLRNMGIRASLSISLWQNGRLWGLIACHHMRPRSLPLALQDAAIGLSQTASSKLSALESRRRHDLGNEISGIIGRLLSIINIDSEDRVLQQLQPELLGLLDAGGLLVRIEGSLCSMGELPAAEQIEALLDWLEQQPAAGVFACDDLPQRFPPAQAYADLASGLLAAPWDGDRRNAMIWLRPERLRTVRWAGNPQKTLLADPSGALRLSPRTSFETWTESWRGRSQGWSAVEQDAAGLLARALTEGIAQKHRLEQAQALHREMQQRYSLALQATNDGIWDWDLANNRVFINPAFAHMLGYSVEELGDDSRQMLERLLPADRHDAVLAQIQRHLREEGDYEMDLRLRCKDGSHRWVLQRASLIDQDPQGQPLRVIGTHTDLTDRKQLEMELREARDHALAASRSKSIFLATMSHELRTPLNGILGMLELARMKAKDNPKLMRHLEVATQSAKELLELISDLLDFTQIEADRLDLVQEDFALDQLLAELQGLMMPAARKKGLEFALQVSPALAHSRFRGDSQRLGQVLRNLLSNAIKFTAQGGVQLSVSQRGQDGPRVLLRFQVQDSGIGISPEDQTRLFSLFEQLDGASNRRFGGSGLGLVLSKRLVELMDGSIGVDSRPGQGSNFWFILPLEQLGSAAGPGQDQPPTPDSAPDSAPDQPQTQPDKKPIDSEQLQRLGRQMLELLQQGNIKAIGLFEEHSELFHATSASTARQLEQALHDFNFEQAAQALRQLLGEQVG